MIKEMVTIQENPGGGALWVTMDSGEAMVYINQRCTEVKNGEIVLSTREAKMFCSIDDAVHIHAGDRISGDIYIKEQQYPVDPDNTELYLSILDDGTYDKANDQYIWKMCVYSEVEDDGDEYVVRTPTVNH